MIKDFPALCYLVGSNINTSAKTNMYTRRDGNIIINHWGPTLSSYPAYIYIFFDSFFFLSYFLGWRIPNSMFSKHFCWWVLQHCTGFARLVWGRLRVHQAFIHSNWFVCSVCFCSLLPRLTLLLSFLDILHCLPRAVGVPLESALNLVSPMSPCGAHDTVIRCDCVTHVTAMRFHNYIFIYVFTHMKRDLQMRTTCMSHDTFSRVSRVALMNSSRHTYGCGISRVWGSHVTHMTEACHAYDWGLTLEALPPRGGGSAECPKRTRGEWDAGVENTNTQNTQINLNKWKLGEP